MRQRYYVLEGHEARAVDDWREWAAWFEKADRRVARTTLIDGSEVSTVFLGMDHAWGSGPPVLFETCVFLHEDTEPGDWSDVHARYCTWAEAELGHMNLCESLTARLAPWTAKART